MDLYAYTQIEDLQAIADRNGISVPRCRGYRLMKNEECVTTAEIEQMITEQALYEAEKLFRLHPSGLFYEYSDRAKARARRYIVIRKNENGFDEPMAVRWDRVHGKRRKAVKRVFKQVRRDVKKRFFIADYPDGYTKMRQVMSEASKAICTKGNLIKTGWIGSGEKQGIGHMLAADKRLIWAVDEDE